MTNNKRIKMTFIGNRGKEIAETMNNTMLKCCYEVNYIDSIDKIINSEEICLLIIFDDEEMNKFKDIKYKRAIFLTERDEIIPAGTCELLIKHVSNTETIKLITMVAKGMWAEQRMLDIESDVSRLPLTMGRCASAGKLFLAVLHDIKNSLAVISGHAQTMEDSPAVESGKDPDLIFSIKTIEKHVGTILNTLGILSGIGQKKEIEKHSMAIAALADNIKLLFSSTSRKTESELSIAINSETPSYIITDSTLLMRALSEVLFNAFENIESSSDGKIRVTIFAESDSNISIEIKDNGTGLNEESCSRLFENFFTQKEAAAGLGLPAARTLISLLGGTITAKNTESKGMVVTVIIPVGE